MFTYKQIKANHTLQLTLKHTKIANLRNQTKDLTCNSLIFVGIFVLFTQTCNIPKNLFWLWGQRNLRERTYIQAQR